MGNLVHMPPRGRYLAREVGRLAGVSGGQIGQWARQGYIRSSQSDKIPRVYSYQDVAEAMVVHQLRDRGVPYSEIRQTLRGLREDPGLGDWPLSQVELATAGATVAILDRASRHRTVEFRVARPPTWQATINVGDLRRIAAELHRGGWAARQLPDLEHIEVDPDRLSGRPTIRGRRIPARSVAELAETDEGQAILRDEYGLDDAEINDARRWWEVARSYQAA